jgi:hypothetical protein
VLPLLFAVFVTSKIVLVLRLTILYTILNVYIHDEIHDIVGRIRAVRETAAAVWSPQPC